MVNLQAQLAFLREQTAQRCINAPNSANPNEKNFGKPTNILPQDLQSWFQMENSNMCSQFLPDFSSSTDDLSSTTQYYNGTTTTLMDLNPIGNYENSGTILKESIPSFSNFDERCNNSMSFDNMQRQWTYQ